MITLPYHYLKDSHVEVKLPPGKNKSKHPCPSKYLNVSKGTAPTTAANPGCGLLIIRHTEEVNAYECCERTDFAFNKMYVRPRPFSHTHGQTAFNLNHPHGFSMKYEPSGTLTLLIKFYLSGFQKAFVDEVSVAPFYVLASIRAFLRLSSLYTLGA